MIRSIVIAALTTTALVGTAHAADLIRPVQDPIVLTTAPAASGFDWSGFYVGVVGGYAGAHSEYSSPALPGTLVSLDPKGGMFGGTIGFNGYYDQFVFGVDADLLWSGVEGSVAPAVGLPELTVDSKLNWIGSVKARAGVAFDRTLVYVNGGLAFGSVEAAVNVPGVSWTSEKTQAGWTVGAGVEHAITDVISIKAEYAYTDLGNINYGDFAGAGTSVDQKFTSHAIKAGVNFRF